MKEKTPASHVVVCFQMLDFETPNSKCEVLKLNSWKITSFSKTTSLQRKPFLRIYNTTNSSPLLVNKYGFMLIIILSNYQQCPLHLKGSLFRRTNIPIDSGNFEVQKTKSASWLGEGPTLELLRCCVLLLFDFPMLQRIQIQVKVYSKQQHNKVLKHTEVKHFTTNDYNVKFQKRELIKLLCQGYLCIYKVLCKSTLYFCIIVIAFQHVCKVRS